MRTCRIVLSLVAGGILSFLPLCMLNAQNDDVVHILDTLVVSDENPLSSVVGGAAMQRFDADALARMGAANVGDALKFMKGVAVRDYGGVGGLKTVAIRGMGAQHTAVMYDGVAVGDCQSGQVDLGRFSTDNLDAVQLTMGQGDDIYQAARAIASAGAVSLETKLPYKNRFNITARAGSYGLYQANALLSRVFDDKWQLTFFGDYTTSQGDYDFKIKDIEARRNNSDVKSARGEANVIFKTHERHTVKAKTYIYYSSRGLPGSVIVNNPLSNERLLSRNMFAQLFYEYTPSSQFKMKAYAKYNYAYDKHTQHRAANDILHNEYSQRESDVSLTAKWTPRFLHNLSLAWSSELFHNTLSATTTHVAMAAVPKRLTLLNALSARYVGRYMSATAAMLYTYADEKADVGVVAPRRKRFSPSLSLSFYPFGDDLSFALSYKESYRLPTFNDLYYQQVGNYLLRPEKSKMLNMGVLYKASFGGWLKEFALSADAYYGRIKDKIVAVPGIFIWKMNNVDRVTLSGVDVNISLLSELRQGYSVRATAVYSYMRAVDDTEGSLVKGNQIIYTPRHSGSVSAVINTPYVNVGYSLLWSGVRFRLPQNIESNEVDAYTDHSLWFSRHWQFTHFSMVSKFELTNILDDNYEIVRYYPMQGRCFRLSLMLNI